MAAALVLGQILKGRVSLYTVTKQLQDCVWLATYAIVFRIPLAQYLIDDTCRCQNNENVVVKSVNHFRLQNERDVLLRFQKRTSAIRPLLDEIEDPMGPPALILRHLDDDVLHASNTKRLTRLEVKYIAKRVLEALSLLHSEGFVHTGTLFIIRVFVSCKIA